MKTLTNVILSGCLALAAGASMAQDATNKPMDSDKPMTMQQCKDHMAMMKKDGVKKDDAMMKKDTMCADMMKKDVDPMKKDSTIADPMKK